MGRLGTSAFIHFTRKDLLSCSINKLNNFLTINGKDSDLQSFKKKINSSLSDHEKEFIKSKSTELKSKLISIEEQYLDLLQGFYELYLKEDDLSKASKYFLEHTYNPTKKEVVSFEKADEDKVMQKLRDSYKDASKTLQMKKSMAIYKEIMETMQVKHEDVSQLDLTMIIDELKKGKDDIREYSDVQIFRMLYKGNALLLKFREIIENRREDDKIRATLETPFKDFLPLLDINTSKQPYLPPPLDLSSIPPYDAKLSSDDLVASPLSDESMPAHRDTILEQSPRGSVGNDSYAEDQNEVYKADTNQSMSETKELRKKLSYSDSKEVRDSSKYERENRKSVLRPNLTGNTGMYCGPIIHDDSSFLNAFGGEEWNGPHIRLGVLKSSLDYKIHNPTEETDMRSTERRINSSYDTSNGEKDASTGQMRYGKIIHCTGRNNVSLVVKRHIESLRCSDKSRDSQWSL